MELPDTWASTAVVLAVGLISGGSGYFGAQYAPVSVDPQARPDPFTGTEGRALSTTIRELHVEMQTLQTAVHELKAVVLAHNNDAWEWKQRILGCEQNTCNGK